MLAGSGVAGSVVAAAVVAGSGVPGVPAAVDDEVDDGPSVEVSSSLWTRSM